MIYKFDFDEKEYILEENNLEYFVNDENEELEGIDVERVLELLSNSNKVDFQRAYYESYCSNCKDGKEEKKKIFDFLEFYFYAYGKDNKFITSSIDNEYQKKSFTRLNREGVVDKSYLVTVIVCKNCGTYSIEVEKFEL
jgi:RNase P subunit RPR2